MDAKIYDKISIFYKIMLQLLKNYNAIETALMFVAKNPKLESSPKINVLMGKYLTLLVNLHFALQE